jgi:hypothetical protein
VRWRHSVGHAQFQLRTAAAEPQQDLTITRPPETQWLRFGPERLAQAA